MVCMHIKRAFTELNKLGISILDDFDGARGGRGGGEEQFGCTLVRCDVADCGTVRWGCLFACWGRIDTRVGICNGAAAGR